MYLELLRVRAMPHLQYSERCPLCQRKIGQTTVYVESVEHCLCIQGSHLICSQYGSDSQQLVTTQKYIPNLLVIIFKRTIIGSLGQILQNCAQGSIADRMKNSSRGCTEAEAKKFTIDIVKGLAYLHDNNIIHRDIKCANILLDGAETAKLGKYNCTMVVKQLLHSL